MNDSTNEVPTTILSNKLYDRLKFIALVLLPAFGAAYFGLGQIWGFPNIEQVLGTVTVLDTVLGMILRQSNANYKNSDARFDGTIDKVVDEGTTLFSLNLDGDPVEVLEEKDEVLFKVTDNTEETPPPKKRTPRKKA